MIELLQKFPALWLAFGIVLASGIFWVANRKVFEWQGIANKALIETLERQITAITEEKDDYKTKLHNEKNEHNACILKMQELEMRPDVTLLFKASETFYTEQSKAMMAQTAAMANLVESIHKHDTGVTEKMKPVYKSLETMGDGIKELLRRTEPIKT